MNNGTIVKVMDKGYGFIKAEGSDKDIFFHSNELIDIAFDDLKEGDAITFEIADGPKGPSAVKVAKA
ncbi:MAG: CspA family cold shock protein [Candidatus Paceibacteria bacterium]|jgi:CspA family cold shock protein